MTKKGPIAGNPPVRPISTKHDYERASVVVKRLSGQIKSDSAAEVRLQGLLREMDKFDDGGDAPSTDVLDEYEYSGPRRRWSDDGPDAD
jgi:hypothetical protein